MKSIPVSIFFLIICCPVLEAQTAWIEQTYPAQEKLLNDVVFVTTTEGWIVGDDGLILHTDDGGANWVTQVSGVASSLNAIHFVNDSTGWIVGDGGTILHTRNAGEQWTQQQSNVSDNLKTINL
jgi:photosystem II stability/assembly factor-like uncharacterized protein